MFELFDCLFDIGVQSIAITHASLASIAADEEFVCEFTKRLKKHKIRHFGCQPGLETGSVRLMRSMMSGKMRPFSPEDWPQVVRNASRVMMENDWVPISTLVMGLPGEAREDIVDTYRLISSLTGFSSIYIPLFFVPMKLTKFEDRRKFTLTMMTKEHWRLIELCWKHNLRQMYKLFERSDRASPTVLKILLRFAIQIIKGIIRLNMNYRLNQSKKAVPLEKMIELTKS